MKKLIKNILILLCFTLFLAPSAFAKDLKPFGGVEWTDSFLDVVIKLNNIPGVTRVWYGEYENMNKIAVNAYANLTGVKTKKELIKRLSKIKMPFRKQMAQKPLIDSKRHYFFGVGVIGAKKININNVESELEVDMLGREALLRTQKDKVLKVKDIYFPHMVYRVTLTSKDVTLRNNYKAIDQKIYSKYSSMLRDKDNENGGVTRIYSPDRNYNRRDGYKNTLTTVLNPSSMMIVYENGKLILDADKEYLANLAKKKSNKQDMSASF